MCPAFITAANGGSKAGGTPSSDRVLRPSLDLEGLSRHSPQPDLARWITRLAGIRRSSRALRYGSYQQVHVSGQQMAFLRQYEGESALVVVNSSMQPETLELSLPFLEGAELQDQLNAGERFTVRGGTLRIPLGPCGGRILVRL